ncbi:MAG TPA: winged helix-turn-helix domain-containing protein [Actinocrinis sp.]
MRLGILGPLLAADDAGQEVRVTATRQRTLLAALLVWANRPVQVDELAEAVWDAAPPAGAARTVRSYVMRRAWLWARTSRRAS